MRRRDFLATPAAAALTSAQAAPRATAAPAPGRLAWRGNWIWVPFEPGVNYRSLNQQHARNSYFYARRAFDLPEVPSQTEVRVTADSRYVLFVNGSRIGFGPARSDPRWQCYDVYRGEVRRALKPGRNVIAAIVHHLGENTFSYILGRMAFLCEADIGSLKLQTDHTWKVLPGLPWQPVPHRLSLQTDFPEIYDARLEPLRWNSPDFDDQQWARPEMIGPPPAAPWGELVPRDIPFFAEQDIEPVEAIERGHSVPMEQEWVFDTVALFGRPGLPGVPKETVIRAQVVPASPGPARFIIGYTLPYEVLVNGVSIARSSRRQSGDSGYMVKDALPPVELPAGSNDLEIRIQLAGRIRNLYFGHAGPAGDLTYRNWSVPPRRNPQTEIAALQQTEILLKGSPPPKRITRIEPSPQDTYVVFDFGREVFGYPVLKLRDAGEGVIDLGYSELIENGRVVPNRAGLNNADRYILRPGAQSWMTFEKRAFRYLQADFRKLTAPVEIESIGLRFSTYPVEFKGSFSCSDPLLNKIWEVGRYTVQLNMDDAFTDCPWRERAMWMGDARVEGLIASYAFADHALLRRCLRLIGDSQTGDGLTFGVYPSAICFRLPSFTLLWIVSIWDYYMHTADGAFLAEMFPKVVKALGFFENWVDEHGLIANLQDHYWVFIDWTSMDNRGEMTSLNSLYAGTLETAAEMALALGRKPEAARLRGIARRTRLAARKRLFDPAKGVFADCRTPQGLSSVVSQPSNVLAVLFGVAEEGTGQRILNYILDPANKVIPVGSPYFSYYLLNALYRFGRHPEALAYIRERWSRMLDAGATTWWETWDSSSSLCHGWSAGPTFDLMSEFAGIKPLEPGFSRVLIEPHPAGLEQAAVTVPTIRGEIKSSWQASSRGFSLDLTLPPRVAARVSLPRIRPAWNRLSADGRPAARAAVEPSKVSLNWSAAGTHRFVLSAEKE